MPTNYTEIFEQAQKEKDQENINAVESLERDKASQDDTASMQANKTASMQAGSTSSMQADKASSMEDGSKVEQLVNLCVRVPKNWHREVKAYAALEEVSLAELIVLAVDHYKNNN